MVVSQARLIIGNSILPIYRTLSADRLLIITRYADSVTHASEETCYQRNRLMMELAEEIVIGYASPGGNLERLRGESESGKKIDFFANPP